LSRLITDRGFLATPRTFHIGYYICMKVRIVITVTLFLVTAMLTHIDCRKVTANLRCNFFDFHASRLSGPGFRPRPAGVFHYERVMLFGLKSGFLQEPPFCVDRGSPSVNLPPRSLPPSAAISKNLTSVKVLPWVNQLPPLAYPSILNRTVNYVPFKAY